MIEQDDRQIADDEYRRDLRQETEEALANAPRGHQLNWTPGHHGKGITTPWGAVHTWNIDPQTEEPHHIEYIEDALHAPEEGLSWKEFDPFEIRPDGLHSGPDGLEKLDPRLKQMPMWTFSPDAKTLLGAQYSDLVQVVDVNHPVKDEPHAPAYCEGPLDKPFAYNPAERTVYLGQPGGYHTDMAPYIPSDDDPLGWPQGRLREPHTETSPYTGEVEHTPLEADWFSKLPENHEEIHQALGAAPLSGKWAWHFNHEARVAKNDEKWQLTKMGMPIGEDYWDAWGNEPQNALYHGTASDRLESIMQHGLHPWDSSIAGGTNYSKPEQEADVVADSPSGWLMPRPNHTYMTADPLEAHLKARDAHPQDMTPITLRIDPKYLDANFINPDEDEMSKYDSELPRHRQPEVRPQGVNSLGEYAEHHEFGKEPGLTQKVFNEGESIGYNGIVPPEAITPGRMLRDENDRRRWQPIRWPFTASLIGDMRDGWGRFAVTAPWEPGQLGKGIYYPETGVLQTWADDRTHLDVWGDDENYSQPGSAHHIVIRPNGSVHDQGAFDRNFGDAQSDVEGLQRALRELNPSLHLDAPDDWSFSPTEPMEEEPSSVSRGEDGGSIHGVQTGSDYAGSL